VTGVDIIIALCIVTFTATCVPMIRARTKLPLATTVPMVVAAAVLTGCYALLGLWLSVAIETLATVGWLILLRRSLS
jgi:hypothetical protein